MIAFETACEIVMSRAKTLGTEHAGLHEALHRILAEDVRADMDMPPFDKSAMDGYACRRVDLEQELAVLETVQAGSPPTRAIGPGECTKIMTGAMLPEGADCVFMVEYAEEPLPGTVRFTGGHTANNICLRGEDFREGDALVRAGTRLEPQHIAVLASAGCARPRVYRRARVGIIATGSELVEPAQQPGPGQIRCSNGSQLYAQALRADAQPTSYGIAPDTEQDIGAALARALAENEVVLLSGGVSKGDFDFVPDIMRRHGIEILFDSIAMKPGKPTTFGVSRENYCFGLPGNPVSTFIQFEALVKPFLYKLMGHDHLEMQPLLPLASRVDAGRGGRASWVPVNIGADGLVRPVEYHGSAHIHALCRADGLIVISADTGILEEGSMVRVRPLR